MPLQKQYPFLCKGRFKNTRNEKTNSFCFSSFCLYLKSFYLSLKKGKDCHALQEKHGCENEILLSPQTPLIIPMGHATSFIAFKHNTIITDPIFGSPSFFFKRYVSCAPNPESLPAISHILISHNHRDHCDIPTLKYLYKKNPHIIVHTPLGTRHIIEKSGITCIHEYTWWQGVCIDNDLSFTFLPAVHWSQYGFLDHNKSLWGSWMIECKNHTIYFAGDTAYGNHFSHIKQHFPHIDCALLPIAPCEPKHVMHETHMDAEQSVQAYYDLGKPLFIPIHWGVFRFGVESLDMPLYILEEIMERNDEREKLVGTKVGSVVTLPESNVVFSEKSFTNQLLSK